VSSKNYDIYIIILNANRVRLNILTVQRRSTHGAVIDFLQLQYLLRKYLHGKWPRICGDGCRETSR